MTASSGIGVENASRGSERNRAMRLLTHGGIFVLLLSTKAVGQLPPDPALKRTVDAREAALAVGDGETWGRLTTDDFLRIEADGVVTTKAERMARLKIDPMQPRSRSERKWRMYGTTAIETWRQARGTHVTRLTQVGSAGTGRAR